MVSVVVPIYNKIEVVYDCIKENIENAAEPIEWIIIDNNSDATKKKGIIKLQKIIKARKHFCQLITEKINTGVAKAWNKGIKKAKGEFVLILNNDCVLAPQWDFDFKQALSMHKADLISAFIIEPGQSKLIKNIEDFRRELPMLEKRNARRFRFGYFVGITLFARKSVFETLNYFDEKFWLSLEETDFLKRALEKKFRIGISGNILGFHYSGVTRKTINYDALANRKYFHEKNGWDFDDESAKLFNKLKRSWQKRLLKLFSSLSTVAEKYPH